MQPPRRRPTGAPRHGARPGHRRAARGGPPGRAGLPGRAGPQRLRRRHPRLRRRLPRPRVQFSFGFAVDHRIQAIVDLVPEACWHPAVEADDSIRDGAWVAEVTGLVDLSSWPEGSRLILRKERPHPGAQLTFTDVDGLRITAFLTDTPPGQVPGQAAGLELRHRQHARVEDRIREAKNTGLRNLPCRAWAENNAWLHVVLTAIDLVARTQLIAFTSHPDLARCEISAFRYRVLHVAARLTRSARRLHLRIDATWRWAAAIAEAFTRLRAAPWPT